MHERADLVAVILATGLAVALVVLAVGAVLAGVTGTGLGDHGVQLLTGLAGAVAGALATHLGGRSVHGRGGAGPVGGDPCGEGGGDERD